MVHRHLKTVKKPLCTSSSFPTIEILFLSPHIMPTIKGHGNQVWGGGVLERSASGLKQIKVFPGVWLGATTDGFGNRSRPPM